MRGREGLCEAGSLSCERGWWMEGALKACGRGLQVELVPAKDPQVCVEHSEADEEGCQMSRRDRRERHHLGPAEGAVLSVGLAGPVCLQRPAKEQEASRRC